MASEQGGQIGLFELACLGVAAHNFAASEWARGHGGARGGMVASDLLDAIPQAVQMLRATGDPV